MFYLCMTDFDRRYFNFCRALSCVECLNEDWISMSSLWALLSWWILVSTFRALESLFFFTRNLDDQKNNTWTKWKLLFMVKTYRGVSGSRRAHRPSIAPERKCSDRVILHPNATFLVAKLTRVPVWEKVLMHKNICQLSIYIHVPKHQYC